jgi:hypothetical protein
LQTGYFSPRFSARVNLALRETPQEDFWQLKGERLMTVQIMIKPAIDEQKNENLKSAVREMAKNEDSPAKLAILQEWDAWSKEHPEAASFSGGLRFFEYLKNRRPDLLMDFRAPGDKWKTVRSWLRAARKVKLKFAERRAKKPGTEERG